MAKHLGIINKLLSTLIMEENKTISSENTFKEVHLLFSMVAVSR